jgi:hypothetical protein
MCFGNKLNRDDEWRGNEEQKQRHQMSQLTTAATDHDLPSLQPLQWLFHV